MEEEHEEKLAPKANFKLFWKKRRYSVYSLVLLTATYLLNQSQTFSLVATNPSMAAEIGYGDKECEAINSTIVEDYLKEAGMNVTAAYFCQMNTSECDESNTNRSLCHWSWKGTGLAYQLLAGPVYIVIFSISGIPLGLIAELHQINRKVILVICVLLWSFMTILGGLTKEYWHIAVTRFLLGIFSAGCVPFSISMIADLFSTASRGAAIGFYNWGVYIGYSFTFLLLIAERTVGWRAVYFIAGIPGVIIGLIILLTVKDPPRGGENNKQEGVLAALSSPLMKLKTAFHHFSNPVLLLLCIGGALRNGAGFVWAYNIVLFFEEYHPGTNTEDWMTWIPLIFGSIGAFLGGYASDKLASKSGVKGRLIILILCVVASAPFQVGTLCLPMPWAFISHIPAYVIGEMWIGVCIAIVVDLVPVDLTASAVAVYFFIIQIIGGNMPLLVPPIADLWNMQIALLLCFPGCYVLGALFFGASLLVLALRKDRSYDVARLNNEDHLNSERI